MKCEFEYTGSFRKCDPITLGTAGLISAGVAAAGTAASAITAGKTNARGSRLAHRQHEWAMKDAEIEREWQEKIQDKMNAWNLEQWNRQNDWNLEQWNRQNQYDSTASQLQRWKDAGLNPLSFSPQNGVPSMQADSLESAGVGSAQSELGSLPHFENPLAGLPNMNTFNDFLMTQLQGKAIDAQIKKTDAERIAINQQAMYDSLMFKQRFDFAGVQIDVAKQGLEESKARVKSLTQTAAELNSKMRLNLSYLEENQRDINFKDLQNYILSQTKDKEVQKVSLDIALKILQKVGMRQDNINKWYEGERLNNEYGNQQDFDRDSKNGEMSWYQRHLLYSQSQDLSRSLQEIGHTKTPFLYSIDKAMSTLQGVTDVFTSFCQGLTKMGVGKNGLRPQSVSQQNPMNMDSYHSVYGTKPYTPWSNR